ncbi:MAG: YdcF family protein [Nitrospirae bacterium]|nr:YdcF family protein [Nitrospirota bacterium]MCL5977794.1 YdcF family protein [Nitrospirota bacterium]
MFIFKKILTPFLLPPGIFIVLLVGFGIWFLLKKQWKAGMANLSIGIFIWLLSISPVSHALLSPLEADFKIPENPQGDVIILLGAGIYGNAPDISGTGVPSEDMLVRLVTVVRLQKRLNIPVIVSSGAISKGEKTEASIGKRFMVDLGVPDNKVIKEEKSRDTIENAKYTAEICEKLGYKKPLLVTSAYHMKRSVMSFEKAGMKVIPFPVQFKTWKNRKYGWESFLPKGFENSHRALHEYLGLLFYKFAY